MLRESEGDGKIEGVRRRRRGSKGDLGTQKGSRELEGDKGGRGELEEVRESRR